MTEVDEKVQRVERFARAQGLAGVLLSRQPNFAWLTAGQSNRIDGSVDAGQGSLLVTAQGKRFVVANTIELPRLQREAVGDVDFEPIEYAWTDDHANPAAPLAAAQRVVTGAIGVDVQMPGGIDVAAELTTLQTPLTDPELARYRALGRDVAFALEQLCRSLPRGVSERAVAAQADSAVTMLGARPIVTLVAGDDRIAAFRHPVPTSRPWTRSLLIGLCAERHGLVVALSRLISTDPASLVELTRATAQVFAQLLAGTRAGVTGGDLFAIAARAYREGGHAGQEAFHHQGGAIGYRSRDWIAHPTSRDVVRDRQAFAWNPSITGTKVEDTGLLVGEHVELITSTGDWPAIEVTVNGASVRAPGILQV